MLLCAYLANILDGIRVFFVIFIYLVRVLHLCLYNIFRLYFQFNGYFKSMVVLTTLCSINLDTQFLLFISKLKVFRIS